ncbi:MAG: hypothetical protein H6Q02_1784 [Acidobacteria bacterium]|jgi:hypothetical protein|nr:hypothetical protein [Acidobacteriota bacterium]
MSASGVETPRPPLRPIGPGLAGFFSLLAFLSLPLLPVIGVLAALLAPLPLVHQTAQGRPAIAAWGWIAVVLAGLTLVVREPWAAVLCAGYLLVAAWPALAVEAWLRRSWATGRWLAIVTLAALAVTCALLVAFALPAAPDSMLETALAPSIKEASRLAATLGSRSADVEAAMASTFRLVAYLAPALVALYVAAVALWLRPRLALFGLPRGGERFATFASEEWLPLGFVVGGLAWVFLPGTAKWLGANLFVTVIGLYFVHGLAIIHFHLGPRLAANRWVRLGIAVLALQLPLAAGVAVLGLADSFFPLRRGVGGEGGVES